MCITAPNIKTATKDIEVFKVFYNGKTPFVGEMSVDEVTTRRASWFDYNLGYTVFKTKAGAARYMNTLYVMFGGLNNTGFTVEALIIPAKTRYAEGTIQKHMVGEGMKAIRCQVLRKKGVKYGK